LVPDTSEAEIKNKNLTADDTDNADIEYVKTVSCDLYIREISVIRG